MGELKVLRRLSDYEFGVEIRTIRDGVNRNFWSYQNMYKCYLSFLGTPILCAFINNKRSVTDTTHRAQDSCYGARYYTH